MRFCHPFTLTANSRDHEQALIYHKRVGAKSGVRCANHISFSSSRARFFLNRSLVRARLRENLTEFPFAHNFSKPDLEVL